MGESIFSQKIAKRRMRNILKSGKNQKLTGQNVNIKRIKKIKRKNCQIFIFRK